MSEELVLVELDRLPRILDGKWELSDFEVGFGNIVERFGTILLEGPSQLQLLERLDIDIPF